MLVIYILIYVVVVPLLALGTLAALADLIRNP